MAILTGNNGVVKIDNAAGSPTAIASVRNYSIELTRDTIETTSMGKDVRTYVGGLSSFSGSADVYFEVDNYTGGTSAVAALNPTTGTVGSAPLTLELYLDSVGSPTGKKFVGEIIVTGYSLQSSMDGLVEASISFQGSGDNSGLGLTFTA